MKEKNALQGELASRKSAHAEQLQKASEAHQTALSHANKELSQTKIHSTDLQKRLDQC